MDYDTIDDLVNDLENILCNIPHSAYDVEGYESAPPEVNTDPNRFRELVYILHNNLVNQNGLWIEMGVGEGRSIQLMSHFKNDGVVYGFDSFKGLPEDWIIGGQVLEKGAFNMDGVPPTFNNDKINIIKGQFKDTLPRFIEQIKNIKTKITLIHIDCNLYSSTKTTLKYLYPFMASECIIVFDELVNYPNYREGELKALFEMHKDYGIIFEWVGMAGEADKFPRQWRRETQVVLKIIK